MKKAFGGARRAGFTIVEMLMVIAVLGVLIGIVTTAASAAVRQARTRKTKALANVVRSGIVAYKAQKGYYPPRRSGALQKWSEDGLDGGRQVDYLTDTAYDQLMREIVTVSIKGTGASPVLDPTGLLAISSAGAGKPNAHGQEFKEAVKKNKAHGSTLSLGSMCFGYPESSSGCFRRFVVRYNGAADDVDVLTQEDYKSKTGLTWPSKP